MTISLLDKPRKDGYATFATAHSLKKNFGSASLWSKLLFSFVDPLMQTGNQRQLNTDDLWELEGSYKTETAFQVYKQQYDRHDKSIIRAMFATYGGEFLLCGLAMLFSTACNVFAPAVLHHVVDSFATATIDFDDLGVWLGVFFASRLLNAVVTAQTIFCLELVAVRFTVALKLLLFQKAMNRKRKGDKEAVDISNLFTSDMNNMLWAAFQINSLWIIPIQIVVVVYMLYAVIDVAAFAGFAVIALSPQRRDPRRPSQAPPREKSSSCSDHRYVPASAGPLHARDSAPASTGPLLLLAQPRVFALSQPLDEVKPILLDTESNSPPPQFMSDSALRVVAPLIAVLGELSALGTYNTEAQAFVVYRMAKIKRGTQRSNVQAPRVDILAPVNCRERTQDANGLDDDLSVRDVVLLRFDGSLDLQRSNEVYCRISLAWGDASEKPSSLPPKVIGLNPIDGGAAFETMIEISMDSRLVSKIWSWVTLCVPVTRRFYG